MRQPSDFGADALGVEGTAEAFGKDVGAAAAADGGEPDLWGCHDATQRDNACDFCANMRQGKAMCKGVGIARRELADRTQ